MSIDDDFNCVEAGLGPADWPAREALARIKHALTGGDSCGAVHPVDKRVCTLAKGHEGEHVGCGPWTWIYGTATPPAYGPVAILVCERCGKRSPTMAETWDTSVVGKRVL